eukprot:Phypoly_transcript_07839.p2 GENE.Phypoly_transcript_07839~~Phypoly_transcript_07839.p2  ORF type:complete len:175 (+),score=29.75 Phypoly_transcript_07839:922-1446(+)
MHRVVRFTNLRPYGRALSPLCCSPTRVQKRHLSQQIAHHDFEMAQHPFSKIEELHDNRAQFDTKDKIHTLKHNNREIKVKVPYYLSDLEPYMTAEPKNHNVLFLIGKKTDAVEFEEQDLDAVSDQDDVLLVAKKNSESISSPPPTPLPPISQALNLSPPNYPTTIPFHPSDKFH